MALYINPKKKTLYTTSSIRSIQYANSLYYVNKLRKSQDILLSQIVDNNFSVLRKVCQKWKNDQIILLCRSAEKYQHMILDVAFVS